MAGEGGKAGGNGSALKRDGDVECGALHRFWLGGWVGCGVAMGKFLVLGSWFFVDESGGVIGDL